MTSKVSIKASETQKLFVGIDVHLNSWKATIMLDQTPFKTFSMDPSAEVLKQYLEKNFPNMEYYSAYEAGFCGFSIHRKLEEKGIKNIVVNPADIPTTDKERKQKEDKRDSKKIANALRLGQLQAIYVPKIEIEELRSLVRFRKTLVKDISRNKARIKQYLHSKGVEIPEELLVASSHWSSNFTKWLREVKFHTESGSLVLNGILDIVNDLRVKLLAITKNIRQIISKDDYYNRTIKNLMSIPGIGFITAATLLTELFDINRFKNVDHLCSFVGLVPSTNSSGEKEKVGGMTHRGNQPIKEMLIESSWIIIKNDPSMAIAYNDLRKRMKPNEAIIRIAKKLLGRIRHVLKTNTTYEINKA
jgi:transposase